MHVQIDLRLTWLLTTKRERFSHVELIPLRLDTQIRSIIAEQLYKTYCITSNEAQHFNAPARSAAKNYRIKEDVLSFAATALCVHIDGCAACSW